MMTDGILQNSIIPIFTSKSHLGDQQRVKHVVIKKKEVVVKDQKSREIYRPKPPVGRCSKLIIKDAESALLQYVHTGKDTKPKLLLELEKIYLSSQSDVWKAKMCLKLMSTSFTIFDVILERILATVENLETHEISRNLQEKTTAQQPQPQPQPQQQSRPKYGEISLRAVTHQYEVTELNEEINKLQLKVQTYKKEVMKMNSETAALRNTVASYLSMEKLLSDANFENRILNEKTGEQIAEIKKLRREKLVFDAKAKAQAADVTPEIKTRVAQVATKWLQKTRITIDMKKHVPDGSFTPRPKWDNRQQFPNLEPWGIDVTRPTNETVSLLCRELMTATTTIATKLLQTENTSTNLIEQVLGVWDTRPPIVSAPNKVLRPFGEPAWLPSYLHSLGVPFDMKFTHQDALIIGRSLFQYANKNSDLTLFFKNYAKERNRSLCDVTYSFLHACQRYSADPNCAVLSLITMGYAGSWMISGMRNLFLTIKQKCQQKETTNDLTARGGCFASQTLKGGICSTADITEIIDELFQDTKDRRMVIQLKHAAFIDCDRKSSCSWIKLFSKDDAGKDARFWSILKLQYLHEFTVWMQRFESETLARSEDVDGMPAIGRAKAREAAVAADPRNHIDIINSFIDTIFETSVNHTQGKETHLPMTMHYPMWVPFPDLVHPPCGSECRYDVASRAFLLDINQQPSPFMGVSFSSSGAGYDQMTVAEFFHVARHVPFTCATPADAPSIPERL